jgi:hypothetical protein
MPLRFSGKRGTQGTPEPAPVDLKTLSPVPFTSVEWEPVRPPLRTEEEVAKLPMNPPATLLSTKLLSPHLATSPLSMENEPRAEEEEELVVFQSWKRPSPPKPAIRKPLLQAKENDPVSRLPENHVASAVVVANKVRKAPVKYYQHEPDAVAKEAQVNYYRNWPVKTEEAQVNYYRDWHVTTEENYQHEPATAVAEEEGIRAPSLSEILATKASLCHVADPEDRPLVTAAPPGVFQLIMTQLDPERLDRLRDRAAWEEESSRDWT